MAFDDVSKQVSNQPIDTGFRARNKDNLAANTTPRRVVKLLVLAHAATAPLCLSQWLVAAG